MADFNNEHYYSLNDYLREQFGEKVYKLSLDGGMTCPNRDGRIGDNGCIFCSQGGSGDFAADKSLSITDQIESAKSRVQRKIKSGKHIAYFQSYTNTYAPLDYLKKIFEEAISHPDIVAISIATRPDCLPDETLRLLSNLNQKKPVWIELGLQTIHQSTADFIRRGYDLTCFEEAVSKLKKLNINVVVHMILGLPHETKGQMLETIDYIGRIGVDGIKIQLLHVLKNTDLASYYLNKKFDVMNMNEYIDLLVECIERLPPNIVIHRITGDGPKSILIEPKWSGNKRLVLNTIKQEFQLRQVIQGKSFKKQLY